MTQPHLPLARLRAAHKRYGGVTALAGIDLSVTAGQVLALLGPNGAGKSTATALLLGLLAADAGEAELFGQNPQHLAARQRIGVMLQSTHLQATLTVRELIDLTRSYYPAPHSIDACAKIAGVADLLERRYGRLSGGQQRRVQFALAICGKPALLFLDEPTTGLDIEARRSIWAAIRSHVAEGGTVRLTTHYLEEAEALADRVAVLGAGLILAEDREQGLLTRKRALPMPRGAYLVAKMAMAALFAAIVSLLLMALAAGIAGVSLAPLQWLGLFAINVIGVLPFAALGLWLGSHFSGSAAVAVINMVYLPMAFLSGRWMPLSMLPACSPRSRRCGRPGT